MNEVRVDGHLRSEANSTSGFSRGYLGDSSRARRPSLSLIPFRVHDGTGEVGISFERYRASHKRATQESDTAIISKWERIKRRRKRKVSRRIGLTHLAIGIGGLTLFSLFGMSSEIGHLFAGVLIGVEVFSFAHKV